MKIERPPSTDLSLGFDLGGRRLAWSVWQGDTLVEANFIEAKKTGHQGAELRDCVRAVEDLLPRAERITVEEPLYGMSTQGSMALAYTAGALLVKIAEVNPVIPLMIASGSWKMSVCGRGNLDKDGVTEWMQREHPDWYSTAVFDGEPNQDVIDAICIGRYPMALRDQASDVAHRRAGSRKRVRRTAAGRGEAGKRKAG